MDRSLTEKQQAFIENFSQTGNAKQSAIKAGYSEATAEQQGHNLKVSPSVQLGAINSLLDRSGYQTITKIEDVTGRKTDAELREELKHLLSTIAVVRGPYDPSDTNGSGSVQ